MSLHGTLAARARSASEAVAVAVAGLQTHLPFPRSGPAQMIPYVNGPFFFVISRDDPELPR